MQLGSFDLKTRIYSVVVALLFVYAEWVNGLTAGVSSIVLFLKGVF